MIDKELNTIYDIFWDNSILCSIIIKILYLAFNINISSRSKYLLKNMLLFHLFSYLFHKNIRKKQNLLIKDFIIIGVNYYYFFL